MLRFPVLAAALLAAAVAPLARARTSLQDLIDGASLVEGDLAFQNFQLLDDFGTIAADSTLLGGISVSTAPTANGASLGVASSGLNVAGNASLVFTFSYDVISSGAPIGASGLDIANAGASGDGIADVFVALQDGSASPLADLDNIVDGAFPEFDVLADSTSFAAQSMVRSMTSVSLSGLGSSDVALVGLITQSFSQVPEPASAALLATGVVAAALRRRRRR